MRKTCVEAINETRVTRWTNEHQSQIIKNVKYTFEDALQANWPKSYKDFKTAVFNIIETALRGVAQYNCATRVVEALMCNLGQTKSIADIIVQAVLSSTGSIVPIAETVDRVVDRAVDERSSRNTEQVSTTTASTDLSRQVPAAPTDKAVEDTI